MHAVHQNWRLVRGIFVAICFLAIAGCSDDSRERAEAQVQRLADDLDQRTTATGVYVRVKPGEIKEKDPWGTPIQASYSQGGIAEMVHVRSAGPDREFNTRDDLTAERMSANLKGVGEGIRKNAEETAASAARGAVKGAVQGVKESIKDSLPGKKKERKQDDPRPDGPAVEKE